MVACVVTILAGLPYLVLKVLWLAGNPVGAGTTGGAELLDVRHLVGDVVTVGLEFAAFALAVVMARPWGRRLPAFLVVGPIWVGAGLLAPIAVGLPLGLVAQVVVGGSPVPAGNGLTNWVYACVYGGFVVQAVSLMAGFVGYARKRWPNGPAVASGAIGPVLVTLGYGMVMVAWSLGGHGWGGPAGFDTVAQRTFLAATGLLVLAGGIAALTRHARLAFVGTAVAVTAGPAGVALSNHGEVGVSYVIISLVGTVAGAALAWSLARPARHLTQCA